MRHVFSITFPVEIHPDPAIHLKTIHNASAQGVHQFAVVQVGQDAYRTHRGKSTVND